MKYLYFSTHDTVPIVITDLTVKVRARRAEIFGDSEMVYDPDKVPGATVYLETRSAVVWTDERGRKRTWQ